ncbi:MAG: hypothetical protein HG424_000810 [candidate division SR1 bacterium]|nr:hypothetical protein [candidate division SR1 bacterium]
MITLLTLSLSLGLVALPLIGSSPTEKKSDPLPEIQAQAEVSQPTGRIMHSGFSPDDPRQRMVAEAYDLGGLDFVSLIECENGLRNPKAIGDGGMSFGLCQLNIRRHGEPLEEERNDRTYQLSVCYQKRKGGTKFYGPQRLIGGKRCGKVVKDRFYFL